MFKWLFCEHEYKFYNTKVEYPLFSNYGYNVFQFVCTKCGDEVNISEIEIKDMLSELQSNYNKSLALGGKSIKSSNIVVQRHNDIDVVYSSPAVTLMLAYYKNKGIDLSQIDQQHKNRGYSHAEGKQTYI